MTGTGCDMYAHLDTIAATLTIEIRARRTHAHRRGPYPTPSTAPTSIQVRTNLAYSGPQPEQVRLAARVMMLYSPAAVMAVERP
ncbi:MAG: hypothetical protein ACLQB1_30265 [Streptosporangiaceae bacterium]